MLRAAKNQNGVIIAIGNDENQSGNYPIGSSDAERLGVWCEFTFEEIPSFEAIEGAEHNALRFKENATADAIELRADQEVLDNPNG